MFQESERVYHLHMDQLTQLKSENASLQAELATLKEQMGLMEVGEIKSLNSN